MTALGNFRRRREVMDTIRESSSGCMQAINRLLVAEVQGKNMDKLKSMYQGGLRYGSLTEKQHSYAVSLIENGFVDKLIQLYDQDAKGEGEEITKVERPAASTILTGPTLTQLHPNYGMFA